MSSYDICVIGAGPAGITAAIGLAEQGLSVVLVESGLEGDDEVAQRLSDAEVVTPVTHSVMQDAVRRGLGGTSALWGGRCVPFDPVDFESRDFVAGVGWPLGYADLSPFLPRACEMLGVGDAAFDVETCHSLTTNGCALSAHFSDTATVRATQLERWSHSPDIWRTHKAKVESNTNITVRSGLTCVGFCQEQQDAAVLAALLRPTLAMENEPEILHARVFVLACGGVESIRLVLNSIRDPSGLKLASPELVGSNYMGHPSGKIADIQLFGDPSATLYGFERDGGVYVRRRITLQPDVLRKERLLNIAFWLDNAPLPDWRHGSGVLSAAYLALTTPGLRNLLAPAAVRKHVAGEHGTQRMRHLLNVLRNPFRTGLFCLQFVWQRYFATPRLPGFFTYSSANRYALHFHAEQAPNQGSAITLSDETDAHGLLRARIALKWSDQDVDSIIRAHAVLDQAIESAGIGKLIYRYPPHELRDAILEQSVDGFHQLGGLHMAADSSGGVTDHQGRLFGTPNVFIASSAVFPTSGQANPTLSLIAFAVRQAEHIAARFGTVTHNA